VMWKVRVECTIRVDECVDKDEVSTTLGTTGIELCESG